MFVHVDMDMTQWLLHMTKDKRIEHADLNQPPEGV